MPAIPPSASGPRSRSQFGHWKDPERPIVPSELRVTAVLLVNVRDPAGGGSMPAVAPELRMGGSSDPTGAGESTSFVAIIDFITRRATLGGLYSR